jgi:hypothetical protein
MDLRLILPPQRAWDHLSPTQQEQLRQTLITLLVEVTDEPAES